MEHIQQSLAELRQEIKESFEQNRREIEAARRVRNLQMLAAIPITFVVSWLLAWGITQLLALWS